jgi:hypothetical protein
LVPWPAFIFRLLRLEVNLMKLGSNFDPDLTAAHH